MEHMSSREFKRAEVNCSFKWLPSERKEKLEIGALESCFFNGNNYVDFSKETEAPKEKLTD